MFKVRHPLAFVIGLLVLLMAANPCQVRGQSAKYEGKRIVTIQFEPRQQPLEPAEINQLLPLHRDQPLRMADVGAAIQRLFATGCYADIQVDAQPYQDGVIIRFLTKNNWFIGHVQVTGDFSSPPNTGQLENATRLDLGQPYTPAKLTEAVNSQSQLLASNGYFRGSIHPVFDWDNDYQQANIRFEVDAGRRARFGTPVLTGNIQLDPNRVLAATRFQRWIIHTWKPMTQPRLRQALESVRAFYEKDHRLEAKVTLDAIKYDAETNAVTPTLHIDAGPRIQVHAVGAKVSRRLLQRYVPIFEEHTVDTDLLSEGARNLQDYLQAEGYFDAEVGFKEQAVLNDRGTIDYLINPGSRHKLVHLEIHGNRYFTSDAIRERMLVRTASFLRFPRGRFSRNLLRRDEETIANLYQSNGFRDVKVTHQIEDNYQGIASDLAVSLRIEEGPQILVASLTVEGIERLDKQEILSKLGSVVHQPFSEFTVAVDRDTILAQYFQSGFPNAMFEWSSKPAAEPNQVDLRYTIREGGQMFVRQVLFNRDGLKHARPSLVYRNLTLNPGDPLSPTAMSETQRKLYELGVFARVDMAVQDPDGATDQKYVLYDLDEARRYSLALGIGAEFARIGGCEYCLDAPAGAAGFSPRVSLGVTRNDLWGLAHSISLRGRVSTLEQQALLTYTWPHFGGKDNLSVAFTGLYDNSRDVRTFSYKREEVSMQLTDRWSKSLTFLYRYTYRRVSVDQATLKITPELIPLLSQPVLLGLVSGTIVQDRRDDPIDPHRGIYNTVDIGLAEHAFGSERNFLKFLARNATYYQLGDKLVLARSTEVGDIYAFHSNVNPLEDIPLPERFFGGGGSSNRGFPEEQSGPRDTETGFPIGGTALFFNQTELRFPLIGDNIGGVLFHDFGNTFSSIDNLSFRVKQNGLGDFDYMVHAVGFGVRYRTPVGPFRVDLAYSINPPRFFGFSGTEQDLVNAGVKPCANVPNRCTTQSVSHFQFFFSIGQTF
jgi:outer membrane protein assembly complex protein YaeT